MSDTIPTAKPKKKRQDVESARTKSLLSMQQTNQETYNSKRKKEREISLPYDKIWI